MNRAHTTASCAHTFARHPSDPRLEACACGVVRYQAPTEFVGCKPQGHNPDRFRCPKCDCLRVHDPLAGSPPRWMCAECSAIITPPAVRP